MDVEELNDPIENNESETILNRHESGKLHILIAIMKGQTNFCAT